MNLTVSQAISIAINNLKLEDNAPCCTKSCLKDGLFELEIRTLLLRYDIYVDVCTGEVVGLNCEPEINYLESNCYNKAA